MSEKIMIVDDALFMRNMIGKMIKKHGDFQIFYAQDGTEAVELYQKEHPYLVLLDITMPHQSGIEVLEALMQLDRYANVVMCSAMGQDQMITNALRMGAKDFIVKPFKEETLVRLLRAMGLL